VGTNWFVVFDKRCTASGKKQRIVGDKKLVGAAKMTRRRTHYAWDKQQRLWRVGGMIALDPGGSYGEEVEAAWSSSEGSSWH